MLRLLLVCLLLPSLAIARPPPGPDPDPAIAAWFQSLKRGDNYPCCDYSDCRRVEEHRTENGSYVVLAHRKDFVMDPADASAWDNSWGGKEDVWMMVPRGNVVIRPDNPTGSAILCYSALANRMFCYVPWDTME